MIHDKKDYRRNILILLNKIIEECDFIDGKDPRLILENKRKEYCDEFEPYSKLPGYLCVLYELGYIEKEDGGFKLKKNPPMARKAYEIHTAARIGRMLNEYPGSWFVTSRLLKKRSKLPVSMKNTGMALLSFKRKKKLKIYKNNQYQIENENREYFLKMLEKYPNVSL